jgi:hypothetical protein
MLVSSTWMLIKQALLRADNNATVLSCKDLANDGTSPPRRTGVNRGGRNSSPNYRAQKIELPSCAAGDLGRAMDRGTETKDGCAI